jgi:hypothetical protein
MITPRSIRRTAQAAFAATCLALPLAAIAGAAAAGTGPRTVDEHRPVDAQGQVEIINVAGRVDVEGWDKPELAVTGTLGAGVEKLEITTSGTRTTVRVVSHGSHPGIHFGWNPTSSEDAKIHVSVPRGNSISAQLVSADLRIDGVAGNQELRTVSGDIQGAVQRELRIDTVSGDIHYNLGTESKLAEVQTVSGDVSINGGGGEVSVKTVSGDGILKLGTTSRLRLKTVSGDFNVTLGLAADGRFDAESVSGDIAVTFPGAMPSAEYDVQTFSGDIGTCNGRQGVREGFGPANRLQYREGAGTAKVRIDTKSGDVHLCTK